MNTIFTSVASLATMGLLFGSGLAYASQKFAVEVDPKEEAVLNALPGANCGGCGFPGCGGLASAIAKGEAPVNACPVGGQEVASKISEIMGVTAALGEKKIAHVICNGTKQNAKDKAIYEGLLGCKAASMVQNGPKSCEFGCLGFGSCEHVCPFDAIHVLEDGIAHVDKNKCVACGKCIEICPKNVINYVPYSKEVIVNCNSKDKGKEAKEKCSTACIGCGICAKNCVFEAITIENNLATIDYDKCTQCLVCVAKCPTKAIQGNLANKKFAEIEADKCIGCTICAKNCPVGAIEGELKSLHKIDKAKCIGCSICENKCPKKAIEMK